MRFGSIDRLGKGRPMDGRLGDWIGRWEPNRPSQSACMHSKPMKRTAQVAEELPAAKALFDKASDILGYDLLDRAMNGPKDVLDSTVRGVAWGEHACTPDGLVGAARTNRSTIPNT